MTKTITVAAAVMRREDGRILLARRRAGKAFDGKWEFPGGKIEAGETREACLARELREEFSIEATVEGYLMSSRAVYPEMIVELHAYEVQYVGGAFELTDHAAIAWVAADEFGDFEVPEADMPVVEMLMCRTSR